MGQIVSLDITKGQGTNKIFLSVTTFRYIEVFFQILYFTGINLKVKNIVCYTYRASFFESYYYRFVNKVYICIQSDLY